ncbi:MAG: hypothetical protein JSS29_20080 [Proteobacteria bacterium]|nr:hypothetical protein [Pseudomonadota bacterium]
MVVELLCRSDHARTKAVEELKMRSLVLLVVVGIVCLGGGFWIGSATAENAQLKGANAALLEAGRAMTAAHPEKAVQYAFAALDRDPRLYSAYEIVGDAITTEGAKDLQKRFYGEALDQLQNNKQSPVAGVLSDSQLSVERSRIEGKLKKLDSSS